MRRPRPSVVFFILSFLLKNIIGKLLSPLQPVVQYVKGMSVATKRR